MTAVVNQKRYRHYWLALLLCCVTACSSVTVRPYGGEKDTTEPDYKASKSYYLGWLIGEHQVNVTEICQQRRVMQMQAVYSLSDMVQSIFTLLIYTPRTAKVWCEKPYDGGMNGG